RLIEHLALEDPHLHADHAIRGLRLGESIVDIRAEGMQRNAPFAIPLRARDLGTVQATGDAHFHAERTTAHRVGHRALHCPAEHHSALELLRDTFGNQLRVELRLTNLRDVDTHVRDRHAYHLRHLRAELFDVFALLADHDAWASSMNRDVHLARRALDVDAAHGRLGKLLLQKLAHLEVRVHVRRKILRRRVPLRGPLARNAEANSDWIDFLTHNYSLRSFGLEAW